MATPAPELAHSLGQPFTLPCGATLGNRFAKAALSEQLGTRANAPGDDLVRLYQRWSESGAGLLVTGNVMVDRSALGEPRNVVLDDERDAEAFSRWAQAAKGNGTQAWMQINHPGRQSPRTLSRRPVAPSAVPVKGTGGVFAAPRELTGTEIETLIQRFARTAGLAVRVGFTGVQIHGAHGYLVSQFLSPLVNQRTDGWGGSPEQRRRFLLDIVRATRAEIGASTPLSVKLNSADFQRGGLTEDESLDVVLALAEEGVDLLEISGGTYESAVMMGVTGQVRESTRAREAYFLAYARRVREHSSIPLMLTGGFRTSQGMADAIDSGAVDIVGLGRPMVLEPDLPRRLLAGAATGSEAKPRRSGIRKLDGLTEIVWHTEQLWRIGRGRSPKPRRHPLLALSHYLRAGGIDSLMMLRSRRG